MKQRPVGLYSKECQRGGIGWNDLWNLKGDIHGSHSRIRATRSSSGPTRGNAIDNFHEALILPCVQLFQDCLYDTGQNWTRVGPYGY